jgi:hypothetical protein
MMPDPPSFEAPPASASASASVRSSTAIPLTKTAESTRYLTSSSIDSSENIKVLVRVRPLVPSEGDDQLSVTIHDPSSLSVTNADNTKSFQCSYDAVLGPSSSQLDVYQTIRECTISVLDGVNATVFAYGQTNSGKVSY